LLFGIAVLSTATTVGVRQRIRAHAAQVAAQRAQDVIASLPPIVPALVSFKEVLSTPGQPDLLSTERQYAIRSDGSEVRVDKQHRNDGVVYLTHWSLELADGTSAQGDDVTRTMTAVKMPRGPYGSTLTRLDPKQNCAASAIGPSTTPTPIVHETVLSFETARILLSDTGKARTTVWRAPNLNCLELRRFAEFKKPDGSVESTSDLFATGVVVGEPDPSLFALMSGHANLSYSERHRRLNAALGGPPIPAAEMQAVERQDATFEKYRLAP